MSNENENVEAVAEAPALVLYRDLRTTEVCQLKTRVFKGEAGEVAIPYVEYASGRTRDLEAGEEAKFELLVKVPVAKAEAPVEV